MKVAVILPAAGLGTRMRPTSPEKAGTSRKQFMLLDSSPILLHTIRKFASSPLVDEIIVDKRVIPIRPDATSGLHTLAIGLYTAGDGRRLPVYA